METLDKVNGQSGAQPGGDPSGEREKRRESGRWRAPYDVGGGDNVTVA